MERRQFLSRVLAVGVVPLAGCQTVKKIANNQGGDQGNGSDCELQTDRQQQVEIQGHSLGTAKSSGGTRVKGKIKNTGDLRITYAKIKATFYSENGSTITSGVDRRINIDPGEVQTFRVYPPPDKMPVNISEIAEYELTLKVVEACVPK